MPARVQALTRNIGESGHKTEWLLEQFIGQSAVKQEKGPLAPWEDAPDLQAGEPSLVPGAGLEPAETALSRRRVYRFRHPGIKDGADSRDSNGRPATYKVAALPLSYAGEMEPKAGFEPATTCLRCRGSTN